MVQRMGRESKRAENKDKKIGNRQHRVIWDFSFPRSHMKSIRYRQASSGFQLKWIPNSYHTPIPRILPAHRLLFSSPSENGRGTISCNSIFPTPRLQPGRYVPSGVIFYNSAQIPINLCDHIHGTDLALCFVQTTIKNKQQGTPFRAVLPFFVALFCNRPSQFL